jgi:hypothetical protein
MSVTRVALTGAHEAMTPARPRLLSDPRNEFLQWNSTFDDLMAVSEVFPIVERDLGGGEADPEQIIAAFRALHAPLGLIYAVNELSQRETEIFGVLYDTDNERPLASLHASVVSDVPQEGQDSDEPIDLWKMDSRPLARAKFARLVHACLLDLIRQDQSQPVETPTGWTPAGPIRPVEWPPRRFRTGR